MEVYTDKRSDESKEVKLGLRVVMTLVEQLVVSTSQMNVQMPNVGNNTQQCLDFKTMKL